MTSPAPSSYAHQRADSMQDGSLGLHPRASMVAVAATLGSSGSPPRRLSQTSRTRRASRASRSSLPASRTASTSASPRPHGSRGGSGAGTAPLTEFNLGMLTSPVIRVLISTAPPQHIPIHSALLAHHSTFFADAIEQLCASQDAASGDSALSTMEIDLRDESPTAVSDFAYWLYTSKLPPGRHSLRALADVYTIGIVLGAPGLRQAALERIRGTIQHGAHRYGCGAEISIRPETASYIYAKTTPDDALRSVAKTACVAEMSRICREEGESGLREARGWLDRATKDVLVDVALEMGVEIGESREELDERRRREEADAEGRGQREVEHEELEWRRRRTEAKMERLRPKEGSLRGRLYRYIAKSTGHCRHAWQKERGRSRENQRGQGNAKSQESGPASDTTRRAVDTTKGVSSFL